MPGYDLSQDLGDHDVTVESVELVDKDGDGANTVVACRFRFKDGEVGGKDLYPCKGDKSLALTRKALKAMGFDMDSRSTNELRENAALLKGNSVRVVVEEHEWNGNVTNRISWVNAIPKAPTKNALSSLDAKLRMVKKSNSEEAL